MRIITIYFSQIAWLWNDLKYSNHEQVLPIVRELKQLALQPGPLFIQRLKIYSKADIYMLPIAPTASPASANTTVSGWLVWSSLLLFFPIFYT